MTNCIARHLPCPTRWMTKGAPPSSTYLLKRCYVLRWRSYLGVDKLLNWIPILLANYKFLFYSSCDDKRAMPTYTQVIILSRINTGHLFRSTRINNSCLIWVSYPNLDECKWNTTRRLHETILNAFKLNGLWRSVLRPPPISVNKTDRHFV